MRSIATDTADFTKLRETGCIYVDKTIYMHWLVSSVGTNLFFISRYLADCAVELFNKSAVDDAFAFAERRWGV